jgi:hypothetical protein
MIQTIRALLLIEHKFDRRPRGISLQQLEDVRPFGLCRSDRRLFLFSFLNGPLEYRMNSEDFKRVQGAECDKSTSNALCLQSQLDTLNPYICLERRSLRIP